MTNEPLTHYRFAAPVFEESTDDFQNFVHAQKNLTVFTNGCFDLLHRGHVQLLNLIGTMGFLVVGLNSDESVKKLKGAGRPVQPFWDRAAILASLRAVKAVVGFSTARCDRLIRIVRPGIYVKGGDYSLDKLDKDELSALKECGAEIIFYPTVSGKSTTALIESK